MLPLVHLATKRAIVSNVAYPKVPSPTLSLSLKSSMAEHPLKVLRFFRTIPKPLLDGAASWEAACK